MSTIKASNIQNGSSASTNIVLNTDGSATFAQMPVGPSYFAMRNKIINGDQRINQRAATITTNGYCTDRWNVSNQTTGAWTAAQSTNAPSGFINSLLVTKTTGGSASAGDFNYIAQYIEGTNITDLAWGTAQAKTVTLSFWVYAGATGTFSGSLRNGSGTLYSYPFTYTISNANTWEFKTVTIAGPTTGTWLTDTGIGVSVFFDLGSGSSNRGAAGAWAVGNFTGATGATAYPTSTSGGIFAITGVQFEVGSVATPFERRQYGQELLLCQRYYQVQPDILVSSYNGTSGTIYNDFMLPVTLRATPTAAITTPIYLNANSLAINSASVNRVRYSLVISSTGYGAAYGQTTTFSSEL